MIDFLEHQNNIVLYITNNFNKYNTDEEIKNFTTDFIDFDLHKGNATIFFDFGQYNFERETNTSELLTAEISVYIAVRNNTSDNLRKKMLNYTTALYKMIEKDFSLGDNVDFSFINNITFYEYTEGGKHLKIAEVNLHLSSEV
jgi:hypothetical protein